MTSTRVGALSLAIILTALSAGACAKNNNAQLAELQVELRAEREFLRETRAELQATVTRLEPLLALMEQATSGKLWDALDLQRTSAAPMPKDDAVGVAADVNASDCVDETGPTDYRISRTCVEELLGNPTTLVRGAQFVPSIKNGRGNGFKLYAIRKTSILAPLGLENGDTIHRFNEVKLDSLETAMEVYSELLTATQIDIELTRRGQAMTLRYTIE